MVTIHQHPYQTKKTAKQVTGLIQAGDVLTRNVQWPKNRSSKHSRWTPCIVGEILRVKKINSYNVTLVI